MSVYYYASGFDINNAFFPSLEKRLKEDIKDYKNIVYIPASNNLEKTLNKYVPAFTNHFKKIGIEFESTHLLTNDTDINVAKEYGDFYLLQDNYINENITQVSLIRIENNNMEILSNNNGRVWKCTKEGINEYK